MSLIIFEKVLRNSNVCFTMEGYFIAKNDALMFKICSQGFPDLL